jgi:hypothetical protein
MKSCIPNGTSINPKTHHTKFYCKGLNFNEGNLPEYFILLQIH